MLPSVLDTAAWRGLRRDFAAQWLVFEAIAARHGLAARELVRSTKERTSCGRRGGGPHGSE